MDSKTFSEKLAAILTREIEAKSISKVHVARTLGVSQQYITQVTDCANRYRKAPVTEDRLRGFVNCILETHPDSTIERDVERLLVKYSDKKYRIVYHVLKLHEKIGDIDRTIQAMEDLPMDD